LYYPSGRPCPHSISLFLIFDIVLKWTEEYPGGIRKLVPVRRVGIACKVVIATRSRGLGLRPLGCRWDEGLQRNAILRQRAHYGARDHCKRVSNCHICPWNYLPLRPTGSIFSDRQFLPCSSPPWIRQRYGYELWEGTMVGRTMGFSLLRSWGIDMKCWRGGRIPGEG